jgi:alkanesulfonate monooxygenase SsuD/methylene tetrahydromethanopterin reductase-like flavin-dependent oxidoreductase (luciferase family)
MKFSFLAMNDYNGAAPGMEVWPVASKYCKRDVVEQSYKSTIALVEHAERIGFDWISVSEHHYAPYMMLPNPLVMAAALTQVVKKAKIALLGPLIPLNNPVRIAEEIAMLDVLSGGRMVSLFLRGTPNEHNTYSTPKEDTRGMTQEGIDLILKAWNEDEPFAWHGKHYNFDNISIWPKGVQAPHCPVYGSGNSDESVSFAAKRKMGIAFSFAAPETVKKWVDLYKVRCAEAGWTPTPDHVIYRGISYVASTDEQAEADVIAYMGAKAQAAAKLQSQTMGGPTEAPLISKPYFVGGVESIIEKFKILADCGVGVVDMNFPIGSFDQREASMALFAQQVMPVARRFNGD